MVALPSWAFDVSVIPVVTGGGYSAGDIMGGLMTFGPCAIQPGLPFILQKVQFSFKVAVTPSLELILFSAIPSNTTTDDNAPYSLNAADTFKVITSLPINALGGYLVDHGTPNTIELGNLAIPMSGIAGSQNVYGLLIDLTGVTLSTISDLQVRLSGI